MARVSWTAPYKNGETLRIGPLIWIFAAISGAALSLSAVEPPPASQGAAEAFHPDPAALEESVLDATRALLREDAAEARRALDRVERGCRRVGPEDESGLPSDLVAWDVAFHSRTNLARELAGRGNMEGTFDSLVAIQRACRGCHEKAVEHGRKAAGRRESD